MKYLFQTWPWLSGNWATSPSKFIKLEIFKYGISPLRWTPDAFGHENVLEYIISNSVIILISVDEFTVLDDGDQGHITQ